METFREWAACKELTLKSPTAKIAKDAKKYGEMK
jgi:hypothetical protein